MQPTLMLIDADPVGRPGIALVSLWGDVDACDHAALDRLRRSLAPMSHVHVDLADVRFAGATLLGFIAGLCNQARSTDGSLHLHGVPRRLVNLLAAAKMEAQFELALVADDTILRLRPMVPSS